MSSRVKGSSSEGTVMMLKSPSSENVRYVEGQGIESEKSSDGMIYQYVFMFVRVNEILRKEFKKF